MEDNCKQLCKDTHTKPKNVLNLGQFPYLSVIPKTSQVYEYNNTHTYEGALDPQVIGDILKNVFEKNKQIFYNSTSFSKLPLLLLSCLQVSLSKNRTVSGVRPTGRLSNQQTERATWSTLDTVLLSIFRNKVVFFQMRFILESLANKTNSQAQEEETTKRTKVFKKSI